MPIRSAKFMGWLVGAAVLGLLLFPVQTIEVRSGRAGKVLLRHRTTSGAVFTFAYIHSIEKIPVEGVFAVEPDGMLRVVETRFPSYGAGLPNPGAGRSDDGKWMVVPAGQRLPEFRFYIETINRSSLRMGDRTFHLNRLIEPGDIVSVRIRRYPLVLAWRGSE